MASKQMSWRDCTLSSGVLIRGPEKLLADRALARLKQLGRNQDPSLAVTEVTANGYQAGSLDSIRKPLLVPPPVATFGNVAGGHASCAKLS